MKIELDYEKIDSDIYVYANFGKIRFQNQYYLDFSRDSDCENFVFVDEREVDLDDIDDKIVNQCQEKIVDYIKALKKEALENLVEHDAGFNCAITDSEIIIIENKSENSFCLATKKYFESALSANNILNFDSLDSAREFLTQFRSYPHEHNDFSGLLRCFNYFNEQGDL